MATSTLPTTTTHTTTTRRQTTTRGGGCNKDVPYLICNLFCSFLLFAQGILYLFFNGNFKSVVLGIYSCVFGVTIFLSEVGVHVLIHEYCKFLDNIFGRGLFYIFAGVLILEQSPVYMFIMALAVIAIGFAFMILYFIPSARPTRK